MDKIDELELYKGVFDSLTPSKREELKIFTPNDFINSPSSHSIKKDIDGSENNFIKIKINHVSPDNTTSVKLVPIKYYICDTENEKEQRFVLYEMSQDITNKDSGLTSIKTHILYYISDGRTNYLRANVLYPFWCLNDVRRQGEDCPYVERRGLSDWGLFKLTLFNNMELNIIDKKIFDITVDELREIILDVSINYLKTYYINLKPYERFEKLKDLLKEHPDIAESIIKKIIIEQLSKFSLHGKQAAIVTTIDSDNPKLSSVTVGIRSVLRRVNNTLDFLIAFININITDFNEVNIDKYRPDFENISKYDMEIPGTRDDDIYLPKSIQNICNTDYNIIEIFRKNLLKEIQKLILNILNLDIIKYKKIKLDPITIDSVSFNKSFRVCSGSDGQFIDSFEERIGKFEKISHTISNIFLRTICSKPINPNIIILKSIFKSFHSAKFDRTYAKTVYDPWGAKCKEKYLKYKTKYLQLKNKSQKNIQ